MQVPGLDLDQTELERFATHVAKAYSQQKQAVYLSKQDLFVWFFVSLQSTED